MELNKVYNMDCIEYMKTLPNECVDLIISDPPYYKAINEKWDKQWKTEEEYLEWTKQWFNECGDIHACGNLRGFQDKQLELETLEKLYDELNKKFFDGML